MIKVSQLYKSFGQHPVLKNVSLTIEKGETIAIMGKSGVGKSVFIRQMIGLEKPDQGEIWIEDQEITKLSGKSLFDATRQMGMLFQSGALFDSMNVFENVIFHLHLHGSYSDEQLQQIAVQSLKLVDLTEEDVLVKMPSELSGGMRKRVALARLIAYKPKILLFDEPTTGLDPITSQVIIDTIIKTRNELNATSVVVTHDIVLAIAVATKIALIDKGEIRIIEKPYDFFNYIGNETIDFFRSITPQQLLKR